MQKTNKQGDQTYSMHNVSNILRCQLGPFSTEPCNYYSIFFSTRNHMGAPEGAVLPGVPDPSAGVHPPPGGGQDPCHSCQMVAAPGRHQASCTVGP